MLVELAIRNFAIIETADIAFGPGLNALTGETGAGKSILIDALGAVLGDRASSEMVRAGARSATIDATFDVEQTPNRAAVLAMLDELEIEPEDGQLILSREVQSSGRSSARLNGRPTTASVLSQIGALLVDVHGQSDHLSLLRPAAQLELLDRFAQTVPLREELAQRFGELRRVRAALADAHTGARERMQRIDLLRYQVEEIGQAALRVGEDEELAVEHARLVNVDRLALDAAAVYETLAGSDEREDVGGAMPSLRKASHLLEGMAGLDQMTEPLRERLQEVLFLLEDVAAEVRDYRDGIEADPARLEAVEERLALIRQLKRKYGADIAEILRHAQAAEAELARLTGSEVDAEALAAREEQLADEVGRLATELSWARGEAGTRLAAQVEQAIADLKMGSAEFAVSLERTEDPRGVPGRDADGCCARYAVDATGIDKVTFMIAPNAGEGLKPLGKIASGGETARLMLALKSILSDVDETPTLVFDEIDVGVGGRSGQVVGEKLWALTSAHQVIVITHLPQIAAFADAHFRIAKGERNGRVISTVDHLDATAREEELAAMLAGVPLTASALQSAAEMVRRAEGTKNQRVVARTR